MSFGDTQLVPCESAKNLGVVLDSLLSFRSHIDSIVKTCSFDIGNLYMIKDFVVLGDLNARVGDGEVEGVVGKYGVPGENESGERLLDICVEQELVIGNSFF